MADQFGIEILDDPDDGVVFRPDPLPARPDDLVFWSNRTDRTITLELIAPIDPPTMALGQDIKAGRTTGLFKVPAGPQSIQYRCKQPLQTHQITISSDS